MARARRRDRAGGRAHRSRRRDPFARGSQRAEPLCCADGARGDGAGAATASGRACRLPGSAAPPGDGPPGQGILWIDDSISTTSESTECAVASFPDREVILLAGGEDRDQDYTGLSNVLDERGVLVVGLPDTGGRLVESVNAAGAQRTALLAPDLPAAVAAARRAAQPGMVVLLSPAAPSYNAYRNFEARGDHFQALARGGA